MLLLLLAARCLVVAPAESCLDTPYSFNLTDPNADYNSMGIDRFNNKDFAQAKTYFKVRSVE